MVKRKDRTARRQILQLKEERSRTYSPPAKNSAMGPAEPSSQGDNDEGDGHDEASKNEPASNNGVPRDVIDDQLEDFMKEIDAISSSVPETDPQGEEDKKESADQEAVTATSGDPPASGTPEVVVGSQEPKSKGSTADTASATEGEVPPCPWVECMDVATGYTYFWHQVTNEVTWDCPPEYEAYWAQYGDPADAEGGAPGAGADAASATTPGTSADTQKLPETSASAPPIAAAAPNSSASTNVQAADSCSVEGETQKLAESSSTGASTASVAQSSVTVETSEVNKRATTSGKKKRKQEAVIGAIIPITSYGASDSSSSEGSDYETYSVCRTRLKRHPSKRAKIAAKKSRAESPPPVAYGPQLPDSILTQKEEPVYGPQLPDAPESMEVTVYGPHLPEVKTVEYGPHLPEEERVVYGPHLPEPEKKITYGPHLPDTSDLESQQPPVLIGPQLPEFSEFVTEKSSTSAFIGPVLPDGFFEKQAERCEEDNPKVQEPRPRSEDPSSGSTGSAKPVAVAEAFSAEALQASETLQESTHSAVVAGEGASVPVETTVGAVPALSGLVDYPGSPVADSETDDEGIDGDNKKASVPAQDSEKEPVVVNYPVMTGGKLQFETVEKDVPKKVVSQDASQGSSNVRASSLTAAKQLKSKQDTEAKNGSQHLVSYGDSESSDDDSMDVDVTAAEPLVPSTVRTPPSSVAGEDDGEERHRGFGCSNSDAADAQVTDVKKAPSAKPFVGVSFVRSSELLVLSECVNQGEEDAKEKAEEAAEEQSSGSEGTAGIERSASPQEQTAPDDSDVDDFDDVVRALDIALLESQKKKAQEVSTKHQDLPSAEKELSSDTSEEEGEIKSSDSSSEEGMTPMPQGSSDSEDESEAEEDARLKKDNQFSKRGTSLKPESKDTLKLDIEEAYKQLTDLLNPLRDVIACRNSYFELVVKTMTRMEDWRAGALDPGYFLRRLHEARAAADELRQLIQASEPTKSDEASQEPLPPGWQRHWDSGHARYFYVQEETGHSQWQFPTATDASGDAIDSTSPMTEVGLVSDQTTAALLLQPAPPPPPETDEAPVEVTAKQEDETRGDLVVDEKVEEKLDGASLDAAEAAFYSSFALSAEPVMNSAEVVSGDKNPAVAEVVPADGTSVDGVPMDVTPVDGAGAPPTVAAPKKKKTKVSAGLTLRKKNIPTLLQKWEKIKEEQKRGMAS
uniref:Formin-binding protein 4 n=1 Tax=Rhipicephalus appendiculatus TaxID=34631 RepID=A0A131YIC8_RHIAP